MKRLYSKISLFIALSTFSLFLFFQSCNKDKFDFEKLTTSDWDPAIALALVNTSLGINDLIAAADSNAFFINSDNVVTLIYKGSPFEISGENVVPLPQQPSINETLLDGVEAAGLPISGTFTKTYNSSSTYSIPGGSILDSIWVKSGSLTFIINSSFQHSGNINISLPSFRKNGIPFSLDIPINYVGSPINIYQNVSLSGYSIDFTSGINPMEIPVISTATVNYQAPNPVNPNDMLTVQQTFGSLDFSGVFGFITAPIISYVDSIEIGVFSNTDTYPGMGEFQLTNPKIKINIENSLGVPINGDLTNLKSSDKNSQITSILPLNGGGFTNNNFIINYPSTLGLISNSNFTVDKSNANVSSLISSTQKDIIYGINLGINSDGIQFPRNFITDNSKLLINTEMELPLEGFAYGFNLIDTVDFEFTDNGPTIESLLVRTNITNGFPFNVRMQLIFWDQNYTPLDSLFLPKGSGIVDNNVILSGKVDSNGKVYQATNKITDIVLGQSNIPNIKNAKYILIKASAETYNAGSGSTNPIVKIYDDYKLDIKLGVKIQGRVNL